MLNRLKKLFGTESAPLVDRPLPQAEHYLREWGIPYKKKNEVLEVNDLVIKGKGLKELPDLGNVVVHNIFDCSNNELTSLKGCPRRTAYFVCSHNKLATLEGATLDVSSSFTCSHNELETLEGAPRALYYFDCHDNKLLSLKGAPEAVRNKMICTGNPMDTLEGAPSSY
jgi:hypothetical protein